MSPFSRLIRKPAFFVMAVILPLALITEFVLLEGTAGISFPSDRGSAASSYEIQERGGETHFITLNRRFSIIDLFATHDSPLEPLVLRETFFMDREYGREGPPHASVTVEALNGSNVRWKFQLPGEHGDVVTDKLYMVTNWGNGETANTYTYFSLVDGQKVHTNQSSALSRDQLEALDLSIKQ